MKLVAAQNLKIKHYFMFTLLYSLIIVVFICVFDFFVPVASNYQGSLKCHSLDLALNIIAHNLLNFIQYLVLAPVMPILFLMDTINTSWAIYVSIELYGFVETLNKLFPHGIVEIPNYTLYSFISFNLMKKFYNTKITSEYIRYVISYKKLFILNIFGIILSGLMEGMIT